MTLDPIAITSAVYDKMLRRADPGWRELEALQHLPLALIEAICEAVNAASQEKKP